MPLPPQKPKILPATSAFLMHEGRRYPLYLENSGWRLRRRSKTGSVDFRTGTTDLRIAEERAKEWLQIPGNNPIIGKKIGANMEAVVALYLAAPKRTKPNVAKDNVSRLRCICRLALDRELEDVKCREIGPELWRKYHMAVFAKDRRPFDLCTRYRENIATNAATRAARCLFLPQLVRLYRKEGLNVRADAREADTLPVPYVAPSKVDDVELVKAWTALRKTDHALWLTIGLARFAGLRREEIACSRAGWIEEKEGAVSISMKDRQEENWFHKTGRPYRAQVIDADLAAWLNELRKIGRADAFIVPDPPSGEARHRWFERTPQPWLQMLGIFANKPLHRLRGLYADHIARVTADQVTAQLAGIKAAQTNLGHTSSATTENHYLSPDTFR